MNILTSRLPALKFVAMFGAAHLGFSLLSDVIVFFILKEYWSNHYVRTVIHVK